MEGAALQEAAAERVGRVQRLQAALTNSFNRTSNSNSNSNSFNNSPANTSSSDDDADSVQASDVHKAAAVGNLTAVSQQLQAGAPVQGTDSTGATALVYAACGPSDHRHAATAGTSVTSCRGWNFRNQITEQLIAAGAYVAAVDRHCLGKGAYKLISTALRCGCRQHASL